MRWMRKSIGWIAGLAVGGFLLWIIGTAVSIQAMQTDSAGILFGKKVPLAAYLSAASAIQHQAILTYGDKSSKRLTQEDLDRQAWERLILLAEARKRKIRVSDQELVKEIAGWPIFKQKDGGFDRNSYESLLQYTLGTSPRVFEEEVRQSLIISKLIQQVVATVALTDQDRKELASPPPAAEKKEDEGKAQEKARKPTEAELLARKRLQAYFNWYTDLLKRANLQKTGIKEREPAKKQKSGR